MKNFTKLLAVILVCIIALSSAACSLTPQWSYKEGDNELAIGVYIYALNSAYGQAQSYAQQTEAYDAEAGTYNGETSFLDVEITDDDGTTMVASEWIKQEADMTLRTILAIDYEFERLGATIDEADVEGYKAYAKEYWEYGPYYSTYGEQYISPYKDVYEPLGISYESFEYFYTSSVKKQAVFDALYGAGGEKEVTDKELTAYFTENYTSYTYFNTNLYKSVEVENEDGTKTNKNEALSKKESDEIKADFKSYVDSINAGTKLDDVVKNYMKDYEIENDPRTSNVEILADSVIGEDLVKEIEKLKEGKASSKVIGADNSQVIYFFYKEAIKNQIDKYIGDATNRATVLKNYKDEEFTKYIEDLANTLNITVSDAVNDYEPSMFEVEAETVQ